MRPFSLVDMFAPMTIHERIKARREKLGLSMEALRLQVNDAIEKLGLDAPKVLSWQTIQQWETKTAPRRKIERAVALALETTPQWLAHGDLPDPSQLSPDALRFAAHFDSMTETQKRRFRLAAILAADAVSDEELAKHLPAKPESER